MLHLKTRTHPALSARKARSIRTALRKRYGASFVTAQIEESATMCTKPAVSFLQLQATPFCAYARTPSPCQTNGTYVWTSLQWTREVLRCSTCLVSVGKANGPERRAAIKQNVRRSQHRKQEDTEREKQKNTKGTGNKAAETEEERSSTFPQWTFKKLENAVVMVTQQIRQQSTHKGAIAKRERKK